MPKNQQQRGNQIKYSTVEEKPTSEGGVFFERNRDFFVDQGTGKMEEVVDSREDKTDDANEG